MSAKPRKSASKSATARSTIHGTTSTTTTTARKTGHHSAHPSSAALNLAAAFAEPPDEEVYSDYADSDAADGFDFPEGFDEARTRRRLIRSRGCTKIVLSLEQQREMGIEIGVNVTAEHPWKQLRKQVLQDYLAYDTPEAVHFKGKLSGFDDDELILVGYAAALSEDNDTFLFFENAHAAQDASVLIAQIEAAERRKARRGQIRQPRKWRSLGSEAEVERMVQPDRRPVVDVEVQSVYPMCHSNRAFGMRRAEDACDGYAELVPRKVADFVNVSRRRVDMFVQSAAPRVAVEQQTDPLFPANAWTQYLYEIGQDKTDEPDEEEEEGEDQPVRRKRGQEIVIPVIPTDRVQELLDNLEFNEVNMYKNDYPAIGNQPVAKYRVPFLTEAFCFVDLARSNGRLVSSMDWHPVHSGIAVVAYSFTTSISSMPITDKTDTIQRSINQPNRVTMWSFDDKLHPKLELETSREVTQLSYCPYDENLVLGGTINGQLIVWDLKGRLQQVETEEVLTAAQARYRVTMRNFLAWTKQETTKRSVRPVALSALQHSHRAALTSISWLSRDSYVTPNGAVKIHPDPKYRFIVTASLDNTIAFWDMDFFDENAAKNPNAPRKMKLPAHMVGEPSEYERLNSLFRPQFVVVYERPISACLIDHGFFEYTPIIENAEPRSISSRVRHRITGINKEQYNNTIVAATMTGQLFSVKCEGTEMTADLVKRFYVKNPEAFAQTHDGIVEAVARNSFCPDLFLSIGRNVLALWRLDLLETPIFWRRCSAKLTDVSWSKDRPSVFFVTRGDGTFEAWDIMARTDAPCLLDSLGGSHLTRVSQHKLSLPTEIVAVGDFNSSLRLFEIPRVFTRQLPNETELLNEYVQREVARKETLHRWQQRFYAGNAAVREAKARAAAEAAIELERLEKEAREREEMRLKREEAEVRRQKARERAKNVFDMPERLEKKWDEMNIRRLMRILMSKKQVDPQLLAKWTAPEKLRLVYNAKKKAAIEQSFAQAANDMAELRAALIPVAVAEEDRAAFVRQNLQKLCLDEAGEAEYYEGVSRGALDWISQHQERSALDFAGILGRGRDRREVLNKTLGSNTQHRNTFYGEPRVRAASKSAGGEVGVEGEVGEEGEEGDAEVAPVEEEQ